MGVATAALALSLFCSRNRLLVPFFLAVAAMVVGQLGFFTPFTFWPRIAYTWTNGQYHVALDLNKLFSAPLALGAVALCLVVSRAWKAKQAS